MCRLLAYLGPTIQLDKILFEPSHSLIAQSYQPREMEVALLNADGFGLGWYHATRQTEPFIYRNTQPIWNDINLPQICRYVESGCVLAHVRSATPGLAVDLHNCQPFRDGALSFIHNGFIENFRHTLYRPIRERLCDRAYHRIHGLTDSEHIFALLLHELETHPTLSLAQGLEQTLQILTVLAQQQQVRVAANIILSDGKQLIAARFDTAGADPSLYWLQDHPAFPGAVLVASEPLFEANWVTCPPTSLVLVAPTCEIQTYPLAFTAPDSSLAVPLAS
ncbi:MAG: ergothioneine biosynthesis protein EgtC [Cyanobacteria bacterium Co-bin13]|nr:ergothioneine biosynthesis protein EgtC [Cyanobacteria bacterium Co-bin13]